MADNSIFQQINDRISIVDLAQYLGFQTVKQGSYYSIKEHDSVKIRPDKNKYIRYSTSSSGKSGDVIDFYMEFCGVDKGVAVQSLKSLCGLDNQRTEPKITRHERPKKVEKKPFELPEKVNAPFKYVYAYLCRSRGIDKDVVTDFVQRGMLYEESKHHNAIFVGYDYDNKPKYAFVKGTNTNAPFAIDQPSGLKYPVGFFVNNNSTSLVITEAVIDAMSVMTISKENGADYKNHNYFSMQGNNVAAIKYHLEHNPQTNQVVIAVDNDDTGDKYREQICELLKDMNFKGKVVDRRPQSKDWNEDLTSGKYKKHKEEDIDYE